MMAINYKSPVLFDGVRAFAIIALAKSSSSLKASLRRYECGINRIARTNEKGPAVNFRLRETVGI